MSELVDLPDPSVQRLVHPLDLPQARRLFLKSWLIASLTSPPVGLCAAAILWFASRNYVAPLIAGAAIIGFGALASRFFRSQAWAFIPRKRQDRQRPLPVTWELAPSLVFAVLLALALLLVTLRLDQPDVPAEVRELTFGMGAAVGLLLLADVVRRLVRHHGDERRRVLLTLPGVVAVIGSIVFGYGVLFDPSGPASWTTVIWGAAIMLLVGIGVGAWRYAANRRKAGVRET